jgi:hypothetical protein
MQKSPAPTGLNAAAQRALQTSLHGHYFKVMSLAASNIRPFPKRDIATAAQLYEYF